MNGDVAGAQSAVGQLPAGMRATDATGDAAREEATWSYVRSPEDVLRVVTFAVLTLVLVAMAVWLEDSIVGFEQDLIQALDVLPGAAARIIHGAAEYVAILITVVVYVLALTTRRYRLLGYLAASTTLTFAVMSGIEALIDKSADLVLENSLLAGEDVRNTAANGVVQLAQIAALFVVIRPFVGARWRRMGIVTISLFLLVELVSSTELPVDLFVAPATGATMGTLVLLAFGRPDRRPTPRALVAGLRGAGLAAAGVQVASVDARGSTPYFASLDDGSRLFVKVLGGQERAADLMFRVYRFLRLRNVGDYRPFSSLRRTIEHEALLALFARDVGVRTPRLRGVADVGSDSMLLAYDVIEGSSIDGIPDEEITDALMRGVWGQIALLRAHRLAHRDLRRANVFVADDGEPWIIDFGFSEVAVTPEILDADVAQMLASFAVVVGPERAVRAAVDELGPDAVGEALPRLQLKALSGATQTALKAQKGLLKELQAEVTAQTGVEEVEFVQLERVSKKTIFTGVLLVAVTYFLLPQLADLPGIFDEIGAANWGWTPLLLLGSAMTYVAASMSLAGSIPNQLAPGPLVMASVGSSFASKLAPAGLGGMALNVRFLQKQGVDETVAVSGVGLNTAAGAVAHISLVGVFILWAGRDAFGSFRLPDPKWFLIGLGVAAVIFVVVMLIPAGRRIYRTRLQPVVMRSVTGVAGVLRSPTKLVLLIGGSVLVTFAYLTTLYLALQAFGGGLPYATVGAVYLVGSAVATAAPTPGGLGALEAALIAGLVSAGLDETVAVPAVFMYRLFTFWVPILPGWLAFQWLQREEYI